MNLRFAKLSLSKIIVFISGLLFFPAIILTSCSSVPDYETPKPDPESSNNIITCKYCSDFGHIIAFSGDQMVIAEYQNVYIYQIEDGIWKLKYEMINQGISGISTIKINGQRMAIGITDPDGMGRVEIYKGEDGVWNLERTLSANLDGDNFGSAIDIDGDRVIVGSNAMYNNGLEGHVYIYRQAGNQWIREANFEAANSSKDDFFGDAVALNDIYAFAGGRIAEKLHLYKFDGEIWTLDSLIDVMGVRALARFEDKIIVRNTIGYQPQLLAFSIDLYGNLISSEISSDFNGEELSDHGEVIDIYQNLVLVDYERTDFCDLFEYSDNSWSKRAQIKGEEGIFCEYYGLGISDGKVAVGGNNYVFIIDL